MVDRKPNCKCAVCEKPIYRRPSHVAKLKNPPTCSHTCSNIQRGCSHLHTPEVIRKRAAKMMGSNNPAWTGGRYVEPEKGYVMIRLPEHHRARSNGYVLEHILVAEKMLKRRLLDGEEIHHINHDREDNRPDNIQIFASHSEHFQLHLPLRPKAPPCKCGKEHAAKGMCTRCYAYFHRTGKLHPSISDD